MDLVPNGVWFLFILLSHHLFCLLVHDEVLKCLVRWTGLWSCQLQLSRTSLRPSVARLLVIIIHLADFGQIWKGGFLESENLTFLGYPRISSSLGYKYHWFHGINARGFVNSPENACCTPTSWRATIYFFHFFRKAVVMLWDFPIPIHELTPLRKSGPVTSCGTPPPQLSRKKTVFDPLCQGTVNREKRLSTPTLLISRQAVLLPLGKLFRYSKSNVAFLLSLETLKELYCTLRISRKLVVCVLENLF